MNKNNLFYSAKILLPKNEADLQKWAVLACDQFTSQPEYWQAVEEKTKNADSVYNIILPEAYLEAPDVESRIEKAHAKMSDYLKNVLLTEIEGFVYTERIIDAGVRQGLIGCVDLEDYSYEKGAEPRIRPSENTVVERIPPRLAVRRGAPLESPHILMLIDDGENTVIEPLAQKKEQLTKLYDFELMLNGGNIKGWAVTDKEEINNIIEKINRLEAADIFEKKYGASKKPFAFAVGDGNHSLATAKAYWQEIKQNLSEEQQQTHPARFCLVELENIQSSTNEIEPIHRVVFNANSQQLLKAFEEYCQKNGGKIVSDSAENEAQSFEFILNNGAQKTKLSFEKLPQPLAVGTLEAFLTDYEKQNPNIKIDYVHGEDSVQELCKKGAVGILLPNFEKSDLFRGVAVGGVLPKKTFSMGHAHEKRYYLECRKITQ